SDCLRVLAHEDAAVVEIRRRIPAREEQDVQERSCSAPAGLTRPVRRLMNRRPLRAKSRTLLRRRCGIASRNRCILSNSTARVVLFLARAVAIRARCSAGRYYVDDEYSTPSRWRAT